MNIIKRLQHAIKNLRSTNKSQSIALNNLYKFLGIEPDLDERVLADATYFACMKVLCESIGKLPLKLLKYNEKNGVETLAKMFKDRENATSDFVVFGKIIELPNLKIQFTSKIILTKDHIKSLIDLYKQDIDGRYVYKGREVAMIPYRGNNRYLVLGVTENG